MKIRMFILILIASMLLSGCGKEEKVFSTAISQIDMAESGHIEQLHDYDSPYTICYKNQNRTYSMYIFSSPIQYISENGYSIIDNTVIQSERESFAYENEANEIKSYFPKTLEGIFRVERDTEYMEFTPDLDISGFSAAKETEFNNMYGDRVDALVYESKEIDLVFYPTKSGIKSEVILKEQTNIDEISYIVKASTSYYENNQNGYILFKNDDGNVCLIYQPLVQHIRENKSEFNIATQMHINKKGGEEFYVEMKIDKDVIENRDSNCPIKLDTSFELYLNKIPDSTVYSERDINNYLANYAVVGTNPVTGEGWHYTRFRLNWYMEINPKNIIKATYQMRNLNEYNNDISISIFDMNHEWSSTLMTWDSRTVEYKEYLKVEGSGSFYNEWDLTDFVRKAFADSTWLEESDGIMLRVEDNNFVILGTSENCLYPPFIKIDMETLPQLFLPQGEINPTT